jgi:hypothetical protein
MTPRIRIRTHYVLLYVAISPRLLTLHGHITDFLNNFLEAFKDLMNGKRNKVIGHFIVFDMKC